MDIQVLAPDVVDQIAAGEVLERPANLVKELVENSLDAGADEIDVEFDQGGRSVTVSDNGRGMSLENLRRAPLRHATSKIRLSQDLFRLSTYGFRGEALSSVAGVSDLSLVSRPKGGEGYRLDGKFGQFSDPTPVSAKPGTEVRVRELFANVPARLAFMKSETAEHTQIKTVLKAFALAREDVSFRARSKGELLFHWPKGVSFQERASQVLQTRFYSGEGELGSVRVEALVSSPQDTQAVNRNLWFFVQGRWVQDRSLNAAVMEAYRNLLMHGEFPSVVIRIRLEPQDVDVNVHPTKAQVKFREPQTVFRAVSRTVRSILEKAPWLGENSASNPSEGQTVALSLGTSSEESLATARFSAPEFDQVQYSHKVFPLAQVKETLAAYRPQPSADPTIEQVQSRFRWADLQVVGQVHLTYIVAQSEDSLYLVDQHAAHERVVFERLMTSFRAGKMDVQSLLLPLVVDLPEPDIQTLLREKNSLEKMGLVLDQMGPESVAVQAIPSLISENSVAEALKKAAFELGEHGGDGPAALERLIGDLFATMACHSVVRAGQSLSLEQMQQLLKQMDEFPLSSFCPHGRPVFTKKRFAEIEREFGRIN